MVVVDNMMSEDGRAVLVIQSDDGCCRGNGQDVLSHQRQMKDVMEDGLDLAAEYFDFDDG